MLFNPNWQPDAVSQLLLKAADLIDNHGLAKGTQRAPDGSMCIAGAINWAAFGRSSADGDPGWKGSDANVAFDRMAEFCGGDPVVVANHNLWANQRYRAFVDFNNHTFTTKEMVVNKLRECAMQKQLVDA